MGFMGLETKTLIHTEDLCFEINAFLESRELIIRGPLKLRIAFEEMKNPRIDGDDLVFEFQNDNFRLELGKDAKKWHDRILAPPKPLSDKLGIKAKTNVHSLSEISSNNLQTAIAANLSNLESADLLIAQTIHFQDLVKTLEMNSERKLPIWIVNKKGKNSPFGENAIREIMRENGYKDNKTCAIDDVWSVTRYHSVLQK